MQTRTNIAMISLTVLWIVTGVFGSLGVLGAAATSQAAQAQVHSVDCGPHRTLRIEFEPRASAARADLG
jgi:hypothetical protein